MMKSDISFCHQQPQSQLRSHRPNRLSGQATARPKSVHPAARDASKRGEAIGSFCPKGPLGRAKGHVRKKHLVPVMHRLSFGP
ncbi:hypothetical protein HZ326_6526 [Fusarium oxysporum f. sp. albedinis]|nr:hypothetical protein HZ326_6526 [Fusarium oxysporum f. sp. albedinis]